MLQHARLVLGRINLPEFLQADAEFLRLAPFVQLEFGDKLFRQRTARALGEKRVFAAQLHATDKGVLGLAVAANAHVAGGDAEDFALVAEQKLDRSETRIDFHAEFFRLGAEIAADIAERADEIAVIIHHRRHEEIGQAQPAGGAEQVEMVVRDLEFQRRVGVFAPPRQQLVKADGVNHHAGQNMRADFGAFFHQHDGKVRIDLLEPYRRRQARWPAADHHHVIIHSLARLELHFAHLFLPQDAFCDAIL